MSLPPEHLVNSVYPLEYFTLPGVKQIAQPDSFWWSSAERYAALDDLGNYLSTANGGTITKEILEIDLGRIREINYLNFDILRAPIDISIEYDAVSTPNRVPVWEIALQKGDLPFENSTNFSVDNRNVWHNVEFNVTDKFGNMIHARYLRLTFSRRDEVWPTSSATPFPWAIFVKHLRVGRYVAELIDTAGPLLNQDTPQTMTPTTLIGLGQNGTHEARQQFVIPPAQTRVGQTPNILGFGILVNPSSAAAADLSGVLSNPQPGASALDVGITIAWSIYDVTNPSAPAKLITGTTGPINASQQTWIDTYFDDSQIITGNSSKVYELRVSSLNAVACDSFNIHSPNNLSSTPLAGTLTFANGSATVNTSVNLTGVLSAGQYIISTNVPDQPLLVSAVTSSTITLSTAYVGSSGAATGSIIYPYTSFNGSTYVQDAAHNLVMRVWSDIADEGQDVLGNSYRHVVRTTPPSNVIVGSTTAGWMSDPMPTPLAVESLYFDVRSLDVDNKLTLSLIEALQIAPRTPGVRMNIYYTQENVHGSRPTLTTEWDNLLWKPVNKTYTLRRNEIITLPQPIRASYVKLEFSKLQPLPYNLPSYPPLPPRVYNRFPTWVETQFQNTRLKQTIQDWFLRNKTPVEQKVLESFADPVQEFLYQEREFLAQLALGTLTDSQVVNSGLVDIAKKALIDNTTGSKIYVQTPDQYGDPLHTTIDQSSILGQMVVQNFDQTTLTTPTENQDPFSTLGITVPTVSTVNDRVSQSFQNLATIPMRFYKEARHIYTQEQASFNKKAYFVGIDKVKFLRIDYTALFDDPLITDILYDDVMLSFNTWERESSTLIPDGATLYVSYEVGDPIFVTDEKVTLSGFNASTLQVPGLARNVIVNSMPNQQGIQYFQNLDYQLAYDHDQNGNLVTVIERSALGNRLTVPLQPLIYSDTFTVVAQAIIPSEPTQDAATVVARAVISGADGAFIPTYGVGTYGGLTTGKYGDLRKIVDDAATVIAVARISGSDTYTP